MTNIAEMIQAAQSSKETSTATTEEILTAPLENTDGPNEDSEYEPEPSLSSELTEKLMGKNNSIAAKLEEAKAKKEALEQEELEAQQQQEEEEQQKQTETPPALSLEVDGQKFETVEAIADHVKTLSEKSKQLETAVSEYQANEAKLIEILDNVPEFSSIISSLATGDTLRVALIKAGIGPEDFSIESETEEDAEALVQAKLERKRAIEEQKKIQKQFSDNSAKSEKILEDFKAKRGLDDKTSQKVVQAMADFVQKSMNGILTEDSLELFLKAVNFETEVERAETKGQIKGRNEKIAIERQKRAGDGIPALGGRSLPIAEKKPNKLEGLIRSSPTSFTQLLKK
jgi:hypothetical protein